MINELKYPAKTKQVICHSGKGVYQIELNNKRYIGSTLQSFNRRKYEHLNKLRHGNHENPYLQNAFNKYGENELDFSILEIVETPEECIIVEQKYIDELNPEYNMCKVAGSRLRTKASEETKQKMSASHMGNKNCLGRKLSEERKQKMSESLMGNHYALGFKHTDETKQKLSEVRKGKTFSDEHKQNLSESLMGHEVSEEARRKMSESHKGKIFSEEHSKNLSEARKGNKNALGYKHTEEARRKMREASKNRKYMEINEVCI